MRARYWKGRLEENRIIGPYLANPPCLADLLSYGLEEVGYEYSDIEPCRNPDELAAAYAGYEKAMASFDEYVRLKGGISLETDEGAKRSFLKVKTAFFKLWSTYACSADLSQMNNLTLDYVNRALGQLDEGSIGHLRPGLFVELIKEAGERVPGAGKRKE